MFGELRRLWRETAVYGLSTVVGRLLNFLLLPLYTHCLVPAEYGIVATVFSYIAFLNVLYSYGMDFAFMRFSKEGPEGGAAGDFSTPFWSIAATSLLLSGLIHAGAGPLARTCGVPEAYLDVIGYGAWILALDALALVPFAELRLSHRAAAYAGIKVANIVLNLTLNYVFLVVMKMGVRGVFLASLLAACASFVMVAPVLMSRLELAFDRQLFRKLLRFALPLVPAGLASMMVQVIDRPILKHLTDDSVVGLYQANYRLGILMMMVVNMFDAAWRPFFLQRSTRPDAKELFARVLTYFAAGAGLVLLFITFFIDDLVALPLLGGRPLIHPAYWGGLSIVPIVTLGYLFNGLYVNFLAPVTLAKRTDLIAYATAAGAFVNISANFLLIPRWGMTGAAVATLLAYVCMAGALYAMGRRVYPIPYEFGRLAHLGVCLAALAFVFHRLPHPMAVKLLLLAAFPISLLATGFFAKDELRALRSAFSGEGEGPTAPSGPAARP